MVGNFAPGRDQMLVCRFLSRLKTSGVDFRFLFIGNADTPGGRACKDYCLSRDLSREVEFLGVRDDVPALLASLHAFIYATRHDTFGIAVIEAIAAGLPVFVNDWGVFREITDNGSLATLYKTGNPDDLLRLFLDFSANPLPYRDKATRAATRVRELYSIQQHASQLREHYARLCSRHS
ncbi:MAG: glycosyltransferase [Odoribacteraceae bacterium]|jgi:glycosyltransferase involved in cell wall biosynthesis|nr:glycosyltransferase [Odoribacteraceae bacterium]